MARKTIAQRIALEGGAEIEAELKKLGFAGTEAFRKLKAEAEKLTSPLRQIQVELQKVGKSFESFGKGFQRVGRTMSTFVTAPIVAGFGLAIKAATDFESKMADIRRVADFPTPEGLQEFGKQLRDMAVALGVSIGELQDIAQAAAAAGVPFNELLGFTELIAKSSVALSLAAGETGLALGKIKTAAGLTVGEVNELAGAIARLADAGAVGDAELVGIVQEVGALGRAAGLTLEEVAAIGASMVGMGVDAESAGTALRNMLLNLSSGDEATAGFRAALAQIGLDAVDVAKRMQTDGIGVILDLFDRLSKKAPEVRLALLQGLFDRRAAQALAPLLGNLKKTAENVDLVADRQANATRVNEEFAIRSETSAQRVKEFRTALEELGITVGEELLPAFTSLTGQLSELVKAFADSGPLVRWGVIIAGIAAAIGPVIFALGQTLRAIGLVARGAAFLTGAFITLQGTIASGGLLAAIVAIGSSLGAFLAAVGLVAGVGGLLLLATRQSAAEEATENHKDAMERLRQITALAKGEMPSYADEIRKETEAHLDSAEAALKDAEAKLKVLEATRLAGLAATVDPTDPLSQAGAFGADARIKEMQGVVAKQKAELAEYRAEVARTLTAVEATKDGIGAMGDTVEEASGKVDKAAGKFAHLPEHMRAGIRSLSDSPFAKAKKGAEELGQSADAEGKKVETAVDSMAAHIRTVPEEFRKVGAAATQAGTQTAAAAVIITTEVGKVGVEITRVQPQVEALTGAVAQVPVALAEAGTVAAGALEPVNTAFATAAANTTQLSTAATTTFTGIEASAAQTAASLPGLFTQAANAIAAAFAAAFAKVKSELAGLTSAVNSAIASMNAALARLRAAIASAKAAAASAKAAGPGGGGGGSGFARGGPVWGPGTATSDSILSWLSNKEFVQPADATAYYGMDFMEMVRRKLLPRNIVDILRTMRGFADGGLVVPRFNLGGLADAARSSLDGLRPQGVGSLALAGIGGSTGALTPVHLHMPGGQTVIVQAEDSALAQMRRAMVDHRRGSTGKVY